MTYSCKKNHDNIPEDFCLKIIRVNFEYLYHTTPINTKETEEYFQELIANQADFVVPKEGDFSRDLQHPKWFTISPYCHYTYPAAKDINVFLKYKILKSYLILLDIRNQGYGQKNVLKDSSPLKFIQDNPWVDGYIGVEDGTEVCLTRPYEIVDPGFEKIDFHFLSEDMIEDDSIYYKFV